MKNIAVFGSSNTDFTFAKYHGHTFDEPITEPIDVFTWAHWIPEVQPNAHVYNYARSAYGLSYSMHVMDMFIWLDEYNINSHSFPKPDLAIIEIPNLARDFMYFGPENENLDMFEVWHEYDGNKTTIRPTTPTMFVQRISKYENYFPSEESDYFKNKIPDNFDSTLMEGSVLSLDTRIKQQQATTLRLKYYKDEFKRRFNCDLLIFYWNNVGKSYDYPSNFNTIKKPVEEWHSYNPELLHDGSHLNSRGSKEFFYRYFVDSGIFPL